MAALDSVVIKITGDSKDLEKTIKQLEKVGKVDRQNAKSFDKTSKKKGKSMDFLNQKAKMLGASLLGAFAIQQVVGSAITILKNFEKELSTLQSITGSTAKEMEFFVNASKEVGKQTKTAAIEVVKAFTLIGSAQPELLKNSKALAEVTKQALLLGKAAGIDAATAATALTSAMNQFGVKAKDAAKFADIFSTSQQKGSSFIQATSEALKNVGATANAAGVSFETTNAAIQALAKGALTGSEAGTALRGVLAKLSSQSDDKINPSMVGLGSTIDELAARNLSLADATKLVGLESATGLLTLIKQNKTFKELDGNLNETGNTMQQMLINTDNLEGSLSDLSGAWEEFVLSLSGSDGVIRGTVDTFTVLLEAFNGTESEAQELAKQFGISGRGLGKLLEEHGTYANVMIALEGQLDAVNLKQGEFGAVVETNVSTAFTFVEILEKWRIQQQKLNGTYVSAEEIESNRVKTIGELKKEMTALKKELDGTVKGSSEYLRIIARIHTIQALLKDDVQKSVGAFGLLKKQINALRVELRNQSVDGEVSKKTVAELNDALDKLAIAEMRLKVALAGTLKPMKAQKLAMDDINKSFESADDLIKDFEEIQREELEKTKDKRLKAIDDIAQAEQQLYGIITQLNTNKLIAIDNKETAALRALDAEGLSEQELAAKRKEIQDKSAVERAKILTKQAKTDKAAAIFDATINTATAVTKALAVTGNPAFAIIVAALAATELAVIAAQPIPTFHTGKKPELAEGEIFAKILKSESVIPPAQSKKYKGAIDSMIDKNFERYVYDEYMLPMMKGMGKKDNSPYDDIHIWNNQRKQIKLTSETNHLLRSMTRTLEPSNRRRSWN